MEIANKITVQIARNEESVSFTFDNVRFEVFGSELQAIRVRENDKAAMNRFLEKQLSFLNKLRKKNLSIDLFGYAIIGGNTQQR